MTFPYITSKLINVGLQQKSIENQSPEYISQDHFNSICVLVDGDNVQLVEQSYSPDGDMYVLNDYGKSYRAQLNDVMQNPMIYVNSDAYNTKALKDSYTKFQKTINNDIAKQQAFDSVYIEQSNLGINMDDKQMQYLFFCGALMIAFTAISVLVGFTQGSCSTIVGMRIARDKRKQIFESVMSFNSDTINKFSESSLMTRATNDINLINSMSMLILQSVLYAPIIVCVGVYFTIQTAPSMAWIILVAVVAVCVAAAIMLKCTIPIFSRMQYLFDKVNLISREVLSGTYVSRAFNRQKYEEERFDKASNALYRVQLFTGRLTAVINPALGLGYSGISVLVLLVGSTYVNVGTLQVGDLMAFTSYSLTVVTAFVSIGMFIGSLPRVSVAVTRIEEVIAAGDIQKVYEKSDKLISEKPRIEFKNVNFSYKKDNNNAVKNLNFYIEPGTTCGVVGTVGSGKSTIVRLLTRLNEIDNGSIKIDGKDIKDIKVAEYRNLFGYAPQQSFLFSGTIGSNVGYGANEDADLSKYVKTAQAEQFVNMTEDGLDRAISQDSTNISGGQRQRLSIARALATDAPVMIFDDCFSALDFSTEQKLRKDLYDNYGDKTKIVISSRLASVKDADKIIVLENGEIVGQGTHDELMKSCAEYINIAKAQLGGDK